MRNSLLCPSATGSSMSARPRASLALANAASSRWAAVVTSPSRRAGSSIGPPSTITSRLVRACAPGPGSPRPPGPPLRFFAASRSAGSARSRSHTCGRRCGPPTPMPSSLGHVTEPASTATPDTGEPRRGCATSSASFGDSASRPVKQCIVRAGPHVQIASVNASPHNARPDQICVSTAWSVGQGFMCQPPKPLHHAGFRNRAG